MLHHWNKPGHHTTSRNQAVMAKNSLAKLWMRLQMRLTIQRKEDILPLRIHSPVEANPSKLHTSSITYGFLQLKRLIYSCFKPYPTEQISSEQTTSENIQIELREVDLSPGELLIFNSTPKKVREKLAWTSGDYPPPGWGIGVEEKFSFPWYAIVILSLIPTGSIVFAVGWWIHHGPTMFGVAAAVVGWSSYLFTLWMVAAKGG